MQVIIDVFRDLLSYVPNPLKIQWTRKRVIAALLVLLALYWFVSRGQKAEEVPAVASTPEVAVAMVANLGGSGTFAITGSVEALAEAQLKAEAGGRVTAVTTEIGKFVSAGQVIATLDNASERASLLSAQGAYESALAANRQGAVGVAEANTALQTANRNAITAVAAAYNSVSGIVKTDIDSYFSSPTTATPGLRINGYGNTIAIVNARAALNTTLSKWQAESNALTADSNVDTSIENSRRYTGEVIALVDSLVTTLQRDTTGAATDTAERAGKIAGLTAVRGALLGVQTSLQGTLTSLAGARDAKERAEISAGTGNGPSASSAQITQALGAVRAAEAQYEKTLVRTPISGVVNALYLKRGDFVAPQADAAVIANNNGKQVVGAITEADSETIKIGDTVRFDDIATGTVTAIAGAVDPKTGKVAIKMSVSNPEVLTTGTTVSVSFADTDTNTSAVATPIVIPLTAVKLLADSAVVFTINGESKLEARTITLGRVLGDSIIVTEGLSKSDSIVVDVRGRKAGEVVTVTY